MSGEPRLFRIDRSSLELQGVNEVDFSDLGVQERKDIQEWVAANPRILGEDLLFISKEFSGFDRTRERPDLLAVDDAGRLVVVELKRDDSGTDVHWQAIKYASYLREASADDIVGMLADYEQVDEEQAARRLSEHIGADDVPNVVNNDQRIILVSHRFPPEVTSAALWLNEKSARLLVTCVTLTPYAGNDQALHVLASTIIPVPGDAGFRIGIGARQASERLQQGGDLRSRNRHDRVSEFLHGVAEAAKALVGEEVKPDKTSRWAGGHSGSRYYHLWYSRSPWRNWHTAYRIEMYPEVQEYPAQIDEAWVAWVGFVAGPVGDELDLTPFEIHADQELRDSGIWVRFEACRLTDDLANRMATVLAKFVTTITPVIEDLGNERD